MQDKYFKDKFKKIFEHIIYKDQLSTKPFIFYILRFQSISNIKD